MPLELDPGVDRAFAREVTLARRQWIIAPPLLREVIAISCLLPKTRGITADNVTPENYEPALDLLVCGLKRAYPGATRDDLLGIPITLSEILPAVMVIIELAGGAAVKSDSAGDAPVGEQAAASPSTTSTGADSSPISSSS